MKRNETKRNAKTIINSDYSVKIIVGSDKLCPAGGSNPAPTVIMPRSARFRSGRFGAAIV